MKSKTRSKSRSKARSKTRLPRPTKGALGNYTTRDPAPKRRASLQKQIREKDYATVIRELNLVATLGKNKAPEASKKMKADMRYLKNNRR